MISSKQHNAERLVLGTAQFGLNYGISNQRGQITQQEVVTILTEAAKAGITTLDTAAAYGNSEERIGAALSETGATLRIISKFPPNEPGKSIKQAFQESMERLRVDSLYGYLLHSYTTYSSNPAILDELLELKMTGKVKKVGISLYHPSEAEELLSRNVPVDMVQFPYSVFDRRFEQLLEQLRRHEVETHVRSVYLQGLYFMQPDRLPQHLQAAAPKVAALQQLAKVHQMPIGAVCLGFVLANPYLSSIVIGVESLETLRENIAYSGVTLNTKLLEALQQLREENENILLPYKWPTT